MGRGARGPIDKPKGYYCGETIFEVTKKDAQRRGMKTAGVIMPKSLTRRLFGQERFCE